MKKNILITGSTDGIGKLTAIKLAKEGHTVFVHGRNTEKLNTVVTEIKELSQNGKIKGFVADFSDLSAVKSMAEQILKEVSGLDVLINNAGIFTSSVSKTKEGIDIRLVVNYLAPYLLTTEILPVFNTESRIVNLSSAAQAPVSINALNGKAPLSVNEAYAQSKLALTMWSFNLADHLTNTTVIAVNPGSLLNTKMAKEAYGQHWSPAEKGSSILYDLAISNEYKGITKKYFDNDKGEVKGVFSNAHSDAYNNTKITELLSFTKQAISINS
ncbi:NAD(P)-dependent dehydrogenase (short-subunit alcohol dehydrogenase family) [Wenyingzhuangia heitensis]|uniref:NAD(P)-dependent dehydrogenase (Short-subunit alcohol dehydrogenase family) n=1 Tax=Wenyingzhuangia heitensis TaxID=1487859 RepID=A0ABX0U768_9FLAO|nr:SDR family NAD(P)-dependent oxidoreductase [Wenyingzhuangia heitensis]NIJ43820.1 NAD(P)-dependent dehydrogenase (short-subunit alcohol dehydrogenase family) [Wenyingzhuangia heitensis]